MEANCLRHTAIPGTSKLFIDFLYHFDRVNKWFQVEGQSAPETYPVERRAAIVEALAEQNPNHPALETLARPEAVAYVTGQQVGLFSGPAYTVYKALTAVRLARQSNEEGKPAVAIFWLASEDHDFAEVNHVWAMDAANHPVILRTEERPALGPVGAITPPEWPLGQLEALLKDEPFGDDVLALVREAYRPGASMADSFRKLVEGILSRVGLLFLDPLHPSIRKIAAPILREALGHGPELTKALLQRNKELEEAGYHAQVHVEQKTSPFFLLTEGNERRVPLRWQNGDLLGGDQSYTIEKLQSMAERISPNALLRPVIQDYLLPTAAYVGGPAEIAYFAQSQVLYQRLLGSMPRLVSRCGFTILDGRVAKLMARYKVLVTDLFGGEEALREKMAKALVPQELDAQFANSHLHIAAELDRLHAEVKAFDPTLGDALAKSRAKMLYQLTKASSKVARESMRRDKQALEDASYLYNGLYPHKHLQERLYTILPFLARHGLDFVDVLFEHVQTECPDHILLTVS
jgi:bacillithiol synthase